MEGRFYKPRTAKSWWLSPETSGGKEGLFPRRPQSLSLVLTFVPSSLANRRRKLQQTGSSRATTPESRVCGVGGTSKEPSARERDPRKARACPRAKLFYIHFSHFTGSSSHLYASCCMNLMHREIQLLVWYMMEPNLCVSGFIPQFITLSS